ncbi:MAG: amidase, partial [Pyrinomonadaceae bacterium]
AEAHLRRIEEVNPRLNAVVTLAPDVIERAREAEAALMRGDVAGPLHGVPLTVKDTIDTEGLRTTSGSLLRADFIPAADAPAVARLRRAGAIPLGKTNTSELALDYTTDNPVFGRTNNPHAPAHTPGGSSGGCAAAVAAYMTPASLGSDLSGSVRVPAHFCGVSALRPTAARVPTAGHLPPTGGPFALGASFGPIARHVEDLALLYGVLADVRPFGVVEKGTASPPDGLDPDLRGRRLAYYTDDGVVPVTAETREAVERVAGALQEAGLVVSEDRPPGVEHGARLWFDLFSRPMQSFLRSMYAGRESEGGPLVRALLAREGGGAAESRDVQNDSGAALAERDRLRAALVEWMKSTPLLVAPVGAVPAFAHGARRVSVGGTELGVFRAFSYAQTFNVFDLPAACVPVGRSRDGLPIGVQIVGRPFAEDSVLAAARAVEEAL